MTEMPLAILQLLMVSVLIPQKSIEPLMVVDALPITSKPIESTAENLAWQAWLMLPPEQKNQEKSRKVTPKSIFTLPFRECPPGHQLYESRCIPTVNIDHNELLTQQLLGFVDSDTNTDNIYEIDYDDEEIVLFQQPQKLNISEGILNTEGGNYDDASQLPNRDEPLKFNFFQQKFPTDYDGEGLMNDGIPMNRNMENNQTMNVGEGIIGLINNTQDADALKEYLQRLANATATAKVNENVTSVKQTNAFDLQTDSTSVSTNLVSIVIPTIATTVKTTATATKLNKNPNETAYKKEASFSISDIDAIALPADTSSTPIKISFSDISDIDAAAEPAHIDDGLEPQHKAHKVSLFKDDSAVQLVTTVISAERHNHEAAQPDISQLLKADALLPLTLALPLPSPLPLQMPLLNNNSSTATKSIPTQDKQLWMATTPTTQRATTITTTTTTTTSTKTKIGAATMNDDALTDVKLAMTAAAEEEEEEEEYNDEVTGIPLDNDASDEITTMPTIFSELLDDVAAADKMEMEMDENEPDKDEYPRSVTPAKNQDEIEDLNQPEDIVEELEKEVVTLEPEITSTVKFTTINIESNDTTNAEAVTTELKELKKAEQQLKDTFKQHLMNDGQHQQFTSIFKKSKVEPVQLMATDVLITTTAETPTKLLTDTTKVVPVSTTATSSPILATTLRSFTTVSDSLEAETATKITQDDSDDDDRFVYQQNQQQQQQQQQQRTSIVDNDDNDQKTATETKTLISTSTTIPTTTTTKTNTHMNERNHRVGEVSRRSGSVMANSVVALTADNDNDNDDTHQSVANIVSVPIDVPYNDRRTIQNTITTTTAAATKTTTTTTTTNTKARVTSEIDMERELRIINDLVKGRRQLSTTATTTATTTTPTTPTITITEMSAKTTESSLTTKLNKNINKIAIVADSLNVGDAAAAAAAAAVAAVAVDEDDADEASTIKKMSASNNNKKESIITTKTITTTTANDKVPPSPVFSWSKTSDTIPPLLSVSDKLRNDSSVTSNKTSSTPNLSINSNRSNRNSKFNNFAAKTTTASSNEFQSNSASAAGSPTSFSTSSSSSSSSSTAASSFTPSSSSTTTMNSDSTSSLDSTTFNVDSTTNFDTILNFDTTTSRSISSSSSRSIENNDSTTPSTSSSSDNSPIDNAFWWLPAGWRLDRNANDIEQPLLLRLWSAFPENQTKVKS